MSPVIEKRERSFGLSVGTICGLLATYALWRARPTTAWIFGTLCVALIGPALLRPGLLTGPSAIWWRLAYGLGWINTRALLSAVFFCMLTPVGLVMRLRGWDPLRRRRDGESGWLPYPERLQTPKHYERIY